MCRHLQALVVIRRQSQSDHKQLMLQLDQCKAAGAIEWQNKASADNRMSSEITTLQGRIAALQAKLVFAPY